MLPRTRKWHNATAPPEAADPAAWTRQTCAAWVAALDKMTVGDYVQRTAGLNGRIGKPPQASSKEGLLSAAALLGPSPG